jgi:hypothetical protein
MGKNKIVSGIRSDFLGLNMFKYVLGNKVMFTKKKYFTSKQYGHLFDKFRFVRDVKIFDAPIISRLARSVPKQQMIAVAYKGGTIKLYISKDWFNRMFNQF